VTETRIFVRSGDITKMTVDAIVNAANERMLGGGGVDGAIHAAAGPELLEACRRVPEVRPGVRCPTGEARSTPAFRLPARWVVHTVGPVWRGGDHGERQRLARCYANSLRVAVRLGARSVAFPAISCGVYRFPPREAARIAVAEVFSFVRHDPRLEEVALVAFDSKLAAVLEAALAEQNSHPADPR